MMYRERIRENYGRLSRSQKRVADFLMTSHREAAFMTASQLAAVLSIDVATITRFAQRLQYQGYPELLEDVRASLQQEISAAFRPVEGANELGQLFVRAIEVQRENLEHTLANIPLEAAEEAIFAIAQARTVYAVGTFTLASLAVKFAVHLSLLGLSAVAITGDGLHMALAARDIGAQDVVVGLGFTAYGSETAAIMQAARDRGARTIAITGSEVSPVAHAGHIILTCTAVTPLHLPSEVTIYAVVDAIFQALAARNLGTINANLQTFGQFYQRYAHHLRPATGSVEDVVLRLY